jgi:putative ABC transport system ATP-binding protein
LNLVAGTAFPDRGSISVAGNELTRVPEYKRAALLGRVFQDPLRGTSAGLTIEENFALAASRGEFRGLGRALGKSLRAEIHDRLALLGLGLEERMRTKVGLLSGGQRQAITIMMAVFRRPLVLLSTSTRGARRRHPDHHGPTDRSSRNSASPRSWSHNLAHALTAIGRS